MKPSDIVFVNRHGELLTDVMEIEGIVSANDEWQAGSMLGYLIEEEPSSYVFAGWRAVRIIDLWREFDIPISEIERIEERFLTFPIGTHREDVWHWFEETFDLTLAGLMFPGDK